MNLRPRAGRAMTMFLRTLLRSRKLWCACFLFAAVPAAALIRVLSFMLNNSEYPTFRLQPVDMFAAPAFHPLDHATPTPSTPSPASKVGKCDLSQGDWVPDHAPPAYTNQTCRHIQDTQNCLRNGRQDSRYLYWKWKPRGCEVLRGNAQAFLRAMRGQKLAFVGDSIARNQMQSMLCILDQVEKPTNTFHSDDDKTNHWFFPSYAFTLTVHWSPFLIKHSTKLNTADASTPITDLDLDVLDDTWVESMAAPDVLVISSGQWFYKAAVYKEGARIIGCHHCRAGARSGDDTVKEIGFFNAYRRALRTVLASLRGARPAVVLRTFAPDHFENGGWDTGGTCPRTVPGGVAISEMNWMMHDIEVTELEKARGDAGNAGKLHLLDITELAQVRSDGHPGAYRHPYPEANEEKEVQIDCLHWCLPGPIDTWNEILMETLQHMHPEL